jgi:hypothetical protein
MALERSWEAGSQRIGALRPDRDIPASPTESLPGARRSAGSQRIPWIATSQRQIGRPSSVVKEPSPPTRHPDSQSPSVARSAPISSSETSTAPVAS